MSEDRVNRSVHDAVRRAGIDPDRAGYSAHSLRAGFATYAASRGLSDRAIQNRTRHKHPSTVRIYTRHESAWTDNAFGVEPHSEWEPVDRFYCSFGARNSTSAIPGPPIQTWNAFPAVPAVRQPTGSNTLRGTPIDPPVSRSQTRTVRSALPVTATGRPSGSTPVAKFNRMLDDTRPNDEPAKRRRGPGWGRLGLGGRCGHVARQSGASVDPPMDKIRIHKLRLC